MKLIGMADSAESLDGLPVAMRHEKCPSKMVPVSFWVMRVEAHCLPNPLNAFFRLAWPSVNTGLLDDDQVVVGIKGDRALLMVLGSFVVVAQEVHGRKDTMHVAVISIEAERDLELVIERLQRS